MLDKWLTNLLDASQSAGRKYLETKNRKELENLRLILDRALNMVENELEFTKCED